MSKEQILIAGCGDVGGELGSQLSAAGHHVYGLRRNINQLPPGIQGISADLSQPDMLQHLPAAIDVVIYAVAAGSREEQRYRDAYVNGLANLLDAIKKQGIKPRLLLFVSSTAVYHQQDHEWVDETSSTEPENFSGRIMLEAESLALKSGIPATVVRFSGIYGPGRNYMMGQVNRGVGYPESPVRYSNRIHRDDCVGVLKYLTELSRKQALDPVYLASDHQPVPLYEVTQWLSTELGVEITESSARRTIGSKRCNSQKLRDCGYRFRFPDYRQGYKDLIREFLKNR